MAARTSRFDERRSRRGILRDRRRLRRPTEGAASLGEAIERPQPEAGLSINLAGALSGSPQVQGVPPPALGSGRLGRASRVSIDLQSRPVNITIPQLPPRGWSRTTREDPADSPDRPKVNRQQMMEDRAFRNLEQVETPERELSVEERRLLNHAWERQVSQLAIDSLIEDGLEVPASLLAVVAADMEPGEEMFAFDSEAMDEAKLRVLGNVSLLPREELESQGWLPDLLAGAGEKLMGGLQLFEQIFSAPFQPNADMVALARELEERTDLSDASKGAYLMDAMPAMERGAVEISIDELGWQDSYRQAVFSPANWIGAPWDHFLYDLPDWSRQAFIRERAARATIGNMEIYHAIGINQDEEWRQYAAEAAYWGASPEATLIGGPFDFWGEGLHNYNRLAETETWATLIGTLAVAGPLEFMGGTTGLIGRGIHRLGVGVRAPLVAKIGQRIAPIEDWVFGQALSKGAWVTKKSLQVATHVPRAGLRYAARHQVPVVSPISRFTLESGTRTGRMLAKAFQESNRSKIASVGRSMDALWRDMTAAGMSERDMQNVLEQISIRSQNGQRLLLEAPPASALGFDNLPADSMARTILNELPQRERQMLMAAIQSGDTREIDAILDILDELPTGQGLRGSLTSLYRGASNGEMILRDLGIEPGAVRDRGIQVYNPRVPHIDPQHGFMGTYEAARRVGHAVPLDVLLSPEAMQIVRRLEGRLNDPILRELVEKGTEQVGALSGARVAVASEISLPDSRRHLSEFFLNQAWLDEEEGMVAVWRELRGRVIGDYMDELGELPAQLPTWGRVMDLGKQRQITRAMGVGSMLAYRFWRESVLSTPRFVTQQLLDGTWRSLQEGIRPGWAHFADYAKGGSKYGVLPAQLQIRLDEALLDPMTHTNFWKGFKRGVDLAPGSQSAEVIGQRAGFMASRTPFMKAADRFDLAIRIRAFESYAGRLQHRSLLDKAATNAKTATWRTLSGVVEEPFDTALQLPETDVAVFMNRLLSSRGVLGDIDKVIEDYAPELYDLAHLRLSEASRSLSSEGAQLLQDGFSEALRTGDPQFLEVAEQRAKQAARVQMKDAQVGEALDLERDIIEALQDTAEMPPEVIRTMKEILEAHRADGALLPAGLKDDVTAYLDEIATDISAEEQRQLIPFRAVLLDSEIAKQLAGVQEDLALNSGLDRMATLLAQRRATDSRQVHQIITAIRARMLAVSAGDPRRALGQAVGEFQRYWVRRGTRAQETKTRVDTLRNATLKVVEVIRRGGEPEKVTRGIIDMVSSYRARGLEVDIDHLVEVWQRNIADPNNALWENYLKRRDELWTDHWHQNTIESIDARFIIELGEAGAMDDAARTALKRALEHLDSGNIQAANQIFRNAGLPIREIGVPKNLDIVRTPNLDALTDEAQATRRLQELEQGQARLVREAEEQEAFRDKAVVGVEAAIEASATKLAEGNRRRAGVITRGRARMLNALGKKLSKERRAANARVQKAIKEAREKQQTWATHDARVRSLRDGDVTAETIAADVPRDVRRKATASATARRPYEQHPRRLLGGIPDSKGRLQGPEWKPDGAVGRAVFEALNVRNSREVRADIWGRVTEILDMMVDGQLTHSKGVADAGQRAATERTALLRYSDSAEEVQRVIDAILTWEGMRRYPSEVAWGDRIGRIPSGTSRAERARLEALALPQYLQGQQAQLDKHVGWNAHGVLVGGGDYGRYQVSPVKRWRDRVKAAKQNIHNEIHNLLNDLPVERQRIELGNSQHRFDHEAVYPGRSREARIELRTREIITEMLRDDWVRLEEATGLALRTQNTGVLYKRETIAKLRPSGDGSGYRPPLKRGQRRDLQVFAARMEVLERDAKVAGRAVAEVDQELGSMEAYYGALREFEDLWVYMSGEGRPQTLLEMMHNTRRSGDVERRLGDVVRGDVAVAGPSEELMGLSAEATDSIRAAITGGRTTSSPAWSGPNIVETVAPGEAIEANLAAQGYHFKQINAPMGPGTRTVLGRTGTISDHLIADAALRDEAAKAVASNADQLAELEQARRQVTDALADKQRSLDELETASAAARANELPEELEGLVPATARKELRLQLARADRFRELVEAEADELARLEASISGTITAFTEEAARLRDEALEWGRAREEATTELKERFALLDPPSAESVTWEELMSGSVLSTPKNQLQVQYRNIEQYRAELADHLANPDDLRRMWGPADPQIPVVRVPTSPAPRAPTPDFSRERYAGLTQEQLDLLFDERQAAGATSLIRSSGMRPDEMRDWYARSEIGGTGELTPRPGESLMDWYARQVDIGMERRGEPVQDTIARYERLQVEAGLPTVPREVRLEPPEFTEPYEEWIARIATPDPQNPVNTMGEDALRAYHRTERVTETWEETMARRRAGIPDPPPPRTPPPPDPNPLEVQQWDERTQTWLARDASPEEIAAGRGRVEAREVQEAIARTPPPPPSSLYAAQRQALHSRATRFRQAVVNMRVDEMLEWRRMWNENSEKAIRMVDRDQVGYMHTSNMMEVLRPFFPFLKFGVWGNISAYRQMLRHPASNIIMNYYYRWMDQMTNEESPLRGRALGRVGDVGIDIMGYLTMARWRNPSAMTNRELGRRYLDDRGVSQLGKILDGVSALGIMPGVLVEVPQRIVGNLYDSQSAGFLDDPQERGLTPWAELPRQITGIMGWNGGRGWSTPLLGAPPGRDFAADQMDQDDASKFPENRSHRHYADMVGPAGIHALEDQVRLAKGTVARDAAQLGLDEARDEVMRDAQRQTTLEDLLNQWVPFIRLGTFSSQDDARRALKEEIIEYFGIPIPEQRRLQAEGYVVTDALNRVKKRILYEAVPGLREQAMAGMPFRTQVDQARSFARDELFQRYEEINLQAQEEKTYWDEALKRWQADPAGQLVSGSDDRVNPEQWSTKIAAINNKARARREEVELALLAKWEREFALPPGSLEMFPDDVDRYMPPEDRLLEEYMGVWDLTDDRKLFREGAGGEPTPIYQAIEDRQAEIIATGTPHQQAYVLMEATRHRSPLELRRSIAFDQYDYLRANFPRWSEEMDAAHKQDIESVITVHRRIFTAGGRIPADKYKAGQEVRVKIGGALGGEWKTFYNPLAPGLFALKRSLDKAYWQAALDRKIYIASHPEIQFFFFWRSTYLDESAEFDFDADALVGLDDVLVPPGP